MTPGVFAGASEFMKPERLVFIKEETVCKPTKPPKTADISPPGF